MTALTPRTLALVLLKVWALTLVVQVILSVPSLLRHLGGLGSDTAAWRSVFGWALVHIVLTAVVAVWVFKFAEPVSAWLVQNSDESDEAHTGSFEAVAFGAMGIYFLVQGLRDCAGLVVRLANKPQYVNNNVSYLWEESAAGLAGAVVQTIAGFILLLGRRGLVRMWRSIRGQEPN